ncbi:LOW QUALITY PROTEIN: hypothetical protein ColTof3_08898 [Colletotrichum tofieldiae]|nr:LOW QUALITY PROTEIN: hypothetical protein ColTof3_08898 [Colletotrichum tofieldiae]
MVWARRGQSYAPIVAGTEHSLLTDLVVTGKADRVLEPLAHHNLQARVAVDLDLAQEFDDIAGANERQAGEDKNQRLDERGSLGGRESGRNGLQQLGQEGTETLLTSLLDELCRKTADFRRRVVLDGGAQQTVDDMEAHLETRSAALVVPTKDLVVVVHQEILDRLGTRTQNLTLVRLHQQTVQLGERGGDETGRQGLGAVLDEGGEQFGGHGDERIVLGDVRGVEGGGQRGQNLGAESSVGGGVGKSAHDLLKGLADQHGSLEIGRAKLGNHEEKVDRGDILGKHNPGVHVDGGAQGLGKGDEELVGVLHLLGVLVLHVLGDSVDDGDLAVSSHPPGADEALNRLDAGDLNNLGLLRGDALDDAVEESGRGLEASGQSAPNKVTAGSQQRLLVLVDGVVDQSKVCLGESLGDGLLHVLEVAQEHVEEVKRRLLAPPQRAVAGEESLGVAKEPLDGLLAVPFAELNKEVARSGAGGVVGGNGGLLGELLLFAADARVADDHLHDVNHPGGLLRRGMGSQLGLELRLDGRRAEALVQEVKLLQNQEVQRVRQVVGVLEAALGLVSDVEVLVRLLQQRQLFPDGGEEAGAVRQEEVGEDGLDLEEGLDDLQLHGNDGVPAVGLAVGELGGCVGQAGLEDLGEEGVPVLEGVLGETLDLLHVILLDDIHEVEARSEDGDGEGAQVGFAALVQGDLGDGLDDVAGHGEELVLAQALIDNVAQNSEGTVELHVGARGDDAQDGGQEAGPSFGEVGGRNLADNRRGREVKSAWRLFFTGLRRVVGACVPGGRRIGGCPDGKRDKRTTIPCRNLHKPLVLVAEGDLEQGVAQLLARRIGDLDGGLAGVSVLGAPVPLDEEAQGAQGGLADGRVDGVVVGDVGQRGREGRVRAGVLELDLGLLAGALLRALGVRQQRNQLVLHVGAGSTVVCRVP